MVVVAVLAAVSSSLPVLDSLSPTLTGLRMIFLALLLIIPLTWYSVGLWRSAGQHIQSRGQPHWGWVARAALAAGIYQFSASNGPLISATLHDGASMLDGDSGLGPYTISVAGDTLAFSGSIDAGSGAALAGALRSAPRVTVIEFNSEGGFITEGVAMARTIRSRDITTWVVGECSSACTMAYLGGSRRYALPGSKLGFHSASVGSLDGADLPTMNAELTDSYHEAGVHAVFIERALSTPSTDMWYPGPAELVTAKVVHEFRSP